ncbi:hypothetical protein [Herpetosiphon giganteus]|uniref:hypothetical protein n=1 Tax=Herpetosiphon giganteus TaxID=2029754 RepID=UPI00195A2CE9|nr:hypothetical protein [Herpetosiphon giganteus]MBM7841574.1 hypothetical protein [Herpetosiphon giganteus]
MAVSYRETLILWSADGTIIKRIDNDLAATFKRLSWNQQTQELAVVDHYYYDKQMYDQIVLFDDQGIRLRRFPMKFDMVREMEWINQVNIIINDFDGVYSFNTSNEKRQRLFEEKQYSIDVDLNHNLVIGNTENNSEELTIWQNGITKTFEIPQFSGRSQAISPRGDYTISYPPYDMFSVFNHRSQQVELYPSIKFQYNKSVEWHPSKPILAMLMYDDIQLWQFPE